MSIQRFFQVLWMRRKLALMVAGITIVSTLAVSLVLPKQYTATTTVVLDLQTPDRIIGSVLPGMTSPGYIATQVDIINSDRVAQRVAQTLNLAANAELKNDWASDAGGKGDINVWIASRLKKKLDVKPSRESSVITLQFTANDPALAATIVNAFANAYIETGIELRAQPARKYATWFKEQAQAQRDRLAKAQAALSAYQQQTGIVISDGRMDFENQKLAELTAQLAQALAEGADSQSKQSAELQGETLPEIMKDPLVIQLKTDIARMESRVKELSGGLGANHPQYRAALSELAQMKSRLDLEMARIAKAIDTQGQVSKAKANELKLAIEEQKKRMFELKGQRDHIDLLSREVESARRDLDSISQRLTQSQLEAMTVQSNISVLTPAVEPLDPSKPLLLLNLVVATLLGSILGAGVAVMAELLQPAIRPDEIRPQAPGAVILKTAGTTPARPRPVNPLAASVAKVPEPGEV